MARSMTSKSKSSLRGRGTSSRNLAALAEEVHLKGSETREEITNKLISLINLIKRELASAAGEDGRLRAVDVIENVTHTINHAKADLKRYSGVNVTHNTSLLDVVHGTRSRFENLRKKFETLRTQYSRANERIQELQTSNAHSNEERKKLAKQFETLAENLGLPENERSTEHISDFVVTLVADANEAKENAAEEIKWARRSQANGGTMQDQAKAEVAAAKSELEDLRQKYDNVVSELENLQNEQQADYRPADYDAVKRRINSTQEERQSLATIIDGFRGIWESILTAWVNCCGQNTENFRNGVKHFWQHLYREILSSSLPLHIPAQFHLPAGDPRYEPRTITDKFPDLDLRKKHDLSEGLACIFKDAVALRWLLHDKNCSVDILRTPPALDQTPAHFPLVIVSSASGLCACLGRENLLSIV